MNNLPQKLFDLRKSRGLLQEELAEKLGVSRQAVSKWEMGTCMPTLENLISISEFFEVTLDSLVKNDYAAAVNSVPENPTGTATNTQIPTVQLKTAHKVIANLLTVIFVRLAMMCISQFTLFITTLLENHLNLNHTTTPYMTSPFTTGIFAIIRYTIDMLSLIPYFFVLYMVFNKNKSLLSRPLFEKNNSASKRLAVTKVMIVFLIRVFFDIATHVVIIRFSLDIAWSGCTTVLEHFLMYAIFTHGKPNIFRYKKAFIPTIMISVTSYIIAATMSFYQLHIVLNTFSIAHMTYPMTYSVMLYLMNYAIVCTFVVFHGIYADKTAA